MGQLSGPEIGIKWFMWLESTACKLFLNVILMQMATEINCEKIHTHNSVHTMRSPAGMSPPLLLLLHREIQQRELEPVRKWWKPAELSLGSFSSLAHLPSQRGFPLKKDIAKKWGGERLCPLKLACAAAGPQSLCWSVYFLRNAETLRIIFVNVALH